MMIKRGIKIIVGEGITYKMAMSDFFLWMDRTYPHCSGQLIVTQVDNNIRFEYTAFDDRSNLSDQDKALIKKKWALVMNKMNQHNEVDKRLVQAIAYIEGGYIVAAINELACYLQEKKSLSIRETF
jgi:predicted secreted Zn-dependent protease